MWMKISRYPKLKKVTLSSYKECTSIKIKKREHGKQNQICLDQSQDYNSLNSVLKPADLNDEYLKHTAASLQLLLHTRAQISKLPHAKCKQTTMNKEEPRQVLPSSNHHSNQRGLSVSLSNLIFFFNLEERLYL